MAIYFTNKFMTKTFIKNYKNYNAVKLIITTKTIQIATTKITTQLVNFDKIQGVSIQFNTSNSAEVLSFLIF